MSANTKFAKQSILGKPPSSSRHKPYAVPTLPNSTAFPKVGETNALSNPVTSNSFFLRESKLLLNNERGELRQESLRINPGWGGECLKLIGKKNQSANVLKSANQKKHKPRVWKPKKVGSKERLASPKPSISRSCLRCSPTGRMFDLKGKINSTSESECQPDCSKGDNACTSNPQKPINKRFPSLTFSMTGCQTWLDTLLIPLLSEYKQNTKKIMEIMNATVDEPSAMACNQMSDYPPDLQIKGKRTCQCVYPYQRKEKSFRS
ncbi:hypothetical protein Tco_0815865 [Tanacetum coccineum]